MVDKQRVCLTAMEVKSLVRYAGRRSGGLLVKARAQAFELLMMGITLLPATSVYL